MWSTMSLSFSAFTNRLYKHWNCLFEGEMWFPFLSSAVYLNVTNIETFDFGHDKFCIKWTPHRAATSYRIKLNPVDCKSLHEVTFTSTEVKQSCTGTQL